MAIKLDPESGPEFIQQQLPHLTNAQAQMAFWQMRMRDVEMGTVSDTDRQVYEAYEQWQMWKQLANDTDYHGQ